MNPAVFPDLSTVIIRNFSFGQPPSEARKPLLLGSSRDFDIALLFVT